VGELRAKMATLAELLATADADEYAVHFRREGFRTIQEILDAGLTQKDLDEMGVADADARNRIVRALFRAASAARLAQNAPQPEQEGVDDTLSLWLSELGVQKLCLPLFRSEGFSSLQEVVDAKLGEDDLKDLGLETMKARKAVLTSLAALAAEGADMLQSRGGLKAKDAGVGVGAAAEATFVQSYQRHRRLSAASLTHERGDTNASFHSAAERSDSGSDGESAVSSDDEAPAQEQGVWRAIGVQPAGDLQAPLLLGAGDPAAAMALDRTWCPTVMRLVVVGAQGLNAGTGFVLLWLGSYSWNFRDLLEREVQDYRVEDSLLDVRWVFPRLSSSALPG
jgi:hypothetical protein